MTESLDDGLLFEIAKDFRKKRIAPDPTIVCVGIGGGGCNIVSNLDRKIPGVKIVCINTDQISNAKRDGIFPITVGRQVILDNRDSGGFLPVAKRAIKVDKPLINENVLNGADVVIMVAGLGGGTGSAGTIEMLRMCKERSIPFHVYAVKPYSFEESRCKIAEQVLSEIRKDSDYVTEFDNNSYANLNETDKDVTEKVNEKLKKTQKKLKDIYLNGLLRFLKDAGRTDIIETTRPEVTIEDKIQDVTQGEEISLEISLTVE
ncbi:MAG: hypothetical protein M1526_06925 [Candidatus Thermoplasmatota archaeon]|jgi:cell division protein FtsZ|nr:hypothetical protein [Candidatus Thermoplasmatota archaeon]MCL5680445.1 hypothetical protein [Candidatus Thermoplasmatota archaeon]